MWLIGIVTAIVMGTLALQTVISAVKDSAAIRAARYAASGMIPVVGGTVAASLSTLASGVTYVKGVIGAGACAVVLVMLISPLVLLILNRAAVSAAITLADFLGVGSVSRLYGAIRRSFDLFIAFYALTVLIFIFEIILFVMTEVPIG
jgi:stage III sporulation protein AE